MTIILLPELLKIFLKELSKLDIYLLKLRIVGISDLELREYRTGFPYHVIEAWQRNESLDNRRIEKLMSLIEHQNSQNWYGFSMCYFGLRGEFLLQRLLIFRVKKVVKKLKYGREYEPFTLGRFFSLFSDAGL